MSVNALLTFDIEFSIAGAFADRHLSPVGIDFVNCPVHQSDGSIINAGLPWVLNCLEQAKVKATFFVEALHRSAFPDDPMANVVRELVARGHEVQLHLHPAWLVFDNPNWRVDPLPKAWPDSIHDLSVEAFAALIMRGQASFAAWGLPAATALRTGSLEHSRDVYLAAKKCGITRCSNMGQALWQHPDKDLHRHDGLHHIEGVAEYPVSGYEDFAIGPKKHHKIATIQGSSSDELLDLGERMHTQRGTHLMILSHAFEYVYGFDDQMRGAKPHHRNQAKLEKLLRVSQARGWQWRTISELNLAPTSAIRPPIKSNRFLTFNRMWHNKFYEWRHA